MPHIVIRGISAERVQTVSKPLIEQLAEICQCGTDNFIIECLHTTAITDGEITPSFPFIEVGWFERGQETRNRFAQALAINLQLLDVPELEIAFRAYREDSYYVNGKLIGE
ncbi:DUF1904 family protein [Paenibacillus sp. MBLB4367]|uniref:DUF1904 family protein n=1 Tax=Paenibacillus sp. MBLB4367 TaxID=3384767 RepID=UPI0039080D81